MEGAISELNNLAGTINWAAPTWDLFIWIFFAVASLLYGLSIGRDRIIVIMVGLYMALAIVGNTPFLRDFSAQINVQGFGFKFSIFIGLFVFFFFMLSRSALSEALSGVKQKGSFAQVVIYSVLHIGLLISIVLSFLPTQSHYVLTEFTRSAFVSDMARFLWLILPIVAMILFQDGSGRKKRKRRDDHDDF